MVAPIEKDLVTNKDAAAPCASGLSVGNVQVPRQTQTGKARSFAHLTFFPDTKTITPGYLIIEHSIIIPSEGIAINRITALSVTVATVGTEITGRHIISAIAELIIIISVCGYTGFGRTPNRSTHHDKEHDEQWGGELHGVCLSWVVCVVLILQKKDPKHGYIL